MVESSDKMQSTGGANGMHIIKVESQIPECLSLLWS